MHTYPKVLLLCSFSQSKADGITTHNLFKGWPLERIAVAEVNDSIDDIFVPDISKYYILGRREMCFIWPFNHLRKLRASEAYTLDAPPKRPLTTPSGDRLGGCFRSILLALQRSFLNKTGLSLVSRRFRVSSEFDNWLREFDPDVIYASAGDIGRLEFLRALKQRYGKKVVIHIFDDFINSKYDDTLFPRYWRKRLDRTFRDLLKVTDLNLAISEKMRREYEVKYDCKFHSFHNSIDPDIWDARPFNIESEKRREELNLSVKEGKNSMNRTSVNLDTKPRPFSTDNQRSFTFLYAGKVNRDTVGPIKQFIETTNTLRGEGFDVRFKLYSPYSKEEVCFKLGQQAEGVYQGKVSYAELPSIFRGADGLLLPLDFTPETIRYIRLSMLTKVTEFLISGTPIFVFAPPSIAVTEYLLEHSAAIHCGEPSKLRESIIKFVQSVEARRTVSRNAVNLAREFHLAKTVNDRLRNLMAV